MYSMVFKYELLPVNPPEKQKWFTNHGLSKKSTKH